MTINVLIWEDYYGNAKSLEELITFNKYYDIDLFCTSDKKAAINYINRTNGFGIYFLDIIDLDNKRCVGVELARKIRAKNCKSMVMFVVNHATNLIMDNEFKLLADSFIYKKTSNWKLDVLCILEYAITATHVP